jgi:hypothetical protein
LNASDLLFLVAWLLCIAVALLITVETVLLHADP